MADEILTTDDFVHAIHATPKNFLKGPDRFEADPAIPDEEEPVQKLFKSIIVDGLAKGGEARSARVIVIGAGPAGLCAAYELKRAGMAVTLLEASERTGGRVKTISAPFTPGLHGEGGAMRLPKDHVLVHTYLDRFGLKSQLEPFQQANKIIYLSSYGRTITYQDFVDKLLARDAELLACFPRLKESEKGKSIDQLWGDAIRPVVELFDHVYQGKPDRVREAYKAITDKFDRYSLRTYFEQVAGWSQDAIALYDLGSPHVVLDNAFIESWKDAFLSSQKAGVDAGMEQMKEGMQQIPFAFLKPSDRDNLRDDITYGARVTAANLLESGKPGQRVEVVYRNRNGDDVPVRGDYVIFAIPFTTVRLLKTNVPFSIAKLNALREVRYVEVTKILLQFKTRWWESYLTDLGQGKDGGVITDLPIRYAMFPVAGSAQFADGQKRGVVMASYTFQQDATISGAMSVESSVQLAIDNLATIFGKAVVDNVEVGTSQVWSADAFSGGSAFAYFAPMQKTRLFEPMIKPEWGEAAHFAGEHASYTHGWIEGAFESALRTAYQIYQLQKARA